MKTIENELIEAVYRGDYERSKVILDKTDIKARKYVHPMQVACRLGNARILELLFQHGAKLPSWTTALKCELKHRDIMISTILALGGNINKDKSSIFPPLLKAALAGDSMLIELLHHNGADIDICVCNLTALQLAVLRGHKGSAKVLIELGADINFN
jgi:Ankyrin repeats (many copies)